MAQALVPLKDLVAAKSRLAGLLGKAERQALVRAMAEDVLTVLATHPQIERVTLVSDDPGARGLAGRLGINYWSEQSLGCSGLNAIVAAASDRLLASSGEQPLIVLHADLPLLGAGDITDVLASRKELDGLVVCCDSAGTGTNLLAFDATARPRFCFGEGSCQLHQSWAREAGLPVQIVRRSGTALDVDTAGDLVSLLEILPSMPPSKTSALLGDGVVAARLRQTGAMQVAAKQG